MVCHKYLYFLSARTNWTECGLVHSKTRTPCELSITYYHELVTTSELLDFVVSFIFVNTFFEFIIRDNIYDLSKDSLSIWYDENQSNYF